MAGGLVAAVAGTRLAVFSKDQAPDAPFAGSFVCIAALQALILVTMLSTSLPRPESKAAVGSGRGLWQIAQQRRFVVAIAGAIGSWGVMSLLMNATPLAMDRQHHAFDDTASVIQWHLLGMYVPAFFSGHLVRRFGEGRVMLAGAALLLAAAAVSLAGSELWYFAVGLGLLGIGWNFLFVGSTTLLTTIPAEEEKAKVQSANDFLVYAVMVAATFSAGTLEELVGWRAVNMGAIPVVVLLGGLLTWFVIVEKDARPGASCELLRRP